MALTKKTWFILSMLLMVTLFSCKEKDPSILKVYVRSGDYILTPNVTVRIVGDLSKGTPEYFDERKTNETGVATFNLDDLFDQYGSGDEKVAYFNVYARDTSQNYTIKQARAKANLTATSTIILED